MQEEKERKTEKREEKEANKGGRGRKRGERDKRRGEMKGEKGSKRRGGKGRKKRNFLFYIISSPASFPFLIFLFVFLISPLPCNLTTEMLTSIVDRTPF